MMILSSCQKRLICIIILLVSMAVLAGCSTPDHWYDMEKVYENNAAEKNIPPVDPTLLPGVEWSEPPPLPGIDNGNLPLSLEQAVLLSLKRNRELRVEQYMPVITGTFEQVERGIFDPELFSEFVYSEETASETSRSTGEQFAVEASDVEARVGLYQQLPTGTGIETFAGFSRSTSDRTPEQQEVKIGLSITQSLLKGFGPAVNLLDIRQAQLDTKASIYELRGFIEALVAEVETAYWKYVLAGEGIAIFERSLKVASQQLDEVEKRIEVGVLPKNDAAAARAEVARREQALIEARSVREERRLRLLRLLNASSEDHFLLKLDPTSQPRTTSNQINDLKTRLELADKMRPDLNEARLRKKQKRLEVVRTRNGLLPKLELFIDLGKTGYAESFSHAFKDIDGDNYDLLTGVRFSAYLGNREARARDLYARSSWEQANVAVENLRNLVELDVRLALNETERTRQQIEASAVTRLLQEQSLSAVQERFEIGASTSLLVAQAQRDLLLSQLAEIEAVVDYRLALVNLYLAEGSLLERRGINFGTL